VRISDLRIGFLFLKFQLEVLFLAFVDRCVWIYLEGSHFRGLKVGLVGLVESVLCVEVGLQLCSNCLEVSEKLLE
jgi:hypothetical protein